MTEINANSSPHIHTIQLPWLHAGDENCMSWTSIWLTRDSPKWPVISDALSGYLEFEHMSDGREKLNLMKRILGMRRRTLSRSIWMANIKISVEFRFSKMLVFKIRCLIVAVNLTLIAAMSPIKLMNQKKVTYTVKVVRR
jgi:hypothetical protein